MGTGPLVMTYRDICRSLRCENAGMIFAYDCGNVEAAQCSKFPEEAYEMEKKISLQRRYIGDRTG